MPTTPEMELLRKMATPSRLGTTIGKEYMGYEFKPYPWLLHVENRVLTAINRPGRDFLIVNQPPQTGKLLALDTPLPTPTGWTTMGEVRVGDFLLGADGRPCRIMAVSDTQMAPRHRVVFDDHSHIDAGPEHLWLTFDALTTANYVGRAPSDSHRTPRHHRTEYGNWWAWRSPKGHGPQVRRTDEILATLKATDGTSNHLVPNTKPLDLPQLALPIEPWVFGYWLGNGSRGKADVHAGSHRGVWDDDFVLGQFVQAGYSPVGKGRRGGCTRIVARELRAQLVAVGAIADKSVPAAYLRASHPQRLAFLRGLMDADGTMTVRSGKPRGAATFTSMDEHLADAVYELAVGLGAKAHRSKRQAKLRGVEKGVSHQVSFTAPFNPFSLPRKADLWSPGEVTGRAITRHHRFIVDIEVSDQTAMRCVTVDGPGSLYLAGRQMVPTHNTTFGMLLTAWVLGMFPYWQAIMIAYSEEYAATWGLRVRNLLQRYGQEFFGVEVSNQQDSKSNWKMSNGFGGMLSVGIGGGLSGHPGNFVWIDDLIKTMEEAGSLTAKAKHLDEFDGSIATRLHEDSTVLITATRFADDDLTGRLVERQNEPGYNGDRFEVISIPALAEPSEDEERELSDEELEEWGDFLGRRRGQALESTHSQDFYESRRRSLPNFIWSAIYQQNPAAREGGMFPKSKWCFWDAANKVSIVRTVRAWDLATTEGGGDWTVGSKFGLGSNGDLYLLDRQRFRKNSGDVENEVLSTARKDGFGVKIIIEQERAGAGVSVVDHYKRKLRGFMVEGARADGTKEQRATPYSIMQNQERVWLPAGEKQLCEEWMDEHRKMMGDGRRPRHDDQIDTGAYAALDLLENTGTSIFIPGVDEIEGMDASALSADRMLDVLAGSNPYFGH